MNFINTINDFVKQHDLINHHDTIVVGLSGGPDSVFLFHFLVQLQKEYNLTLIAAHLNHEWRQQANQEEELCHVLAQKNGISFVSARLSELQCTKKYNGSKEEYARNMRRFFLEETARKYNAQHIALGHHAQDQQETFFIRLIRGASLTGLTAMKPQQGLYIRPLLETNKSDILEWLSKENISYALDATNNSQLYLRNRIRSEVVPALQKCDERFNETFLATLHRLQQDEAYLTDVTQKTFETISLKTDSCYVIDIKAFFATHNALHHRLIIHWLIAENVQFPITQTFLNEIIRFLQSPRGGKHTLSQKWSLIKKQHKASIVSH